MAKKFFTDDSLSTLIAEIKAFVSNAISGKANSSDLTSHTGNKSNPHGVTLAQLSVTATAAELNVMDGVTATTAELNYVDGVTSNIQTQLNSKQATVTGAATTITGSNLTVNRALISNGSGKVAVSAVTSTELGYLDGVTSAIQTQLDGKAASDHTHSAYVNQNAFSNIAVSGQTTVAADSATDTVTFAGSNVAITTNATSDTVTFTVANGTTSAKGVVQLTDSTSSTSTTTAATPKSVKTAYDLANLAANIVYVGPTMPTDPNVKVWINTAEEGTGVVPVLPRMSTITLSASAWTGSSSPYSQSVSIPTVTSATKVELNATVAQIVSLQNDDIALMAENNNGVVTVYSFGGKPSNNMTMQVTLMEVATV